MVTWMEIANLREEEHVALISAWSPCCPSPLHDLGPSLSSHSVEASEKTLQSGLIFFLRDT